MCIRDRDDTEHVGWYYIPVKNGKATWMDPYLNSNVNVYMISYVVPIMIDNEAIGVVGMDIDFNPVSYTHLDVYKRQDGDSTLCGSVSVSRR